MKTPADPAPGTPGSIAVPSGLIVAWSGSYQHFLLHAPGPRNESKCGSHLMYSDMQRRTVDVSYLLVRVCGRCRRIAPAVLADWVTRLAEEITEARRSLVRLEGWPQITRTDGLGEFDDVDTETLHCTGTDGYGQRTPTVRELAAILAALPAEVQDLPVTRYCDEGIRGLRYETSYDRRPFDEDTRHVSMW